MGQPSGAPGHAGGPIPRGLLQGGSPEAFQGMRAPAFIHRATDYRGAAPGIDLDVGTFPATLASGYLRAGRDDARIVPGVQTGAALLVPLGRRSAVRFDLSRRLCFDRNERTGAFWSVGVGFVILPRGVTIPSGGPADDRAPPPP